MPETLTCTVCRDPYPARPAPDAYPTLCPDCADDQFHRPETLELRMSVADFALLERANHGSDLILPDFVVTLACEMARALLDVCQPGPNSGTYDMTSPPIPPTDPAQLAEWKKPQPPGETPGTPKNAKGPSTDHYVHTPLPWPHYSIRITASRSPPVSTRVPPAGGSTLTP